jgi:hypothetical protein
LTSKGWKFATAGQIPHDEQKAHQPYGFCEPINEANGEVPNLHAHFVERVLLKSDIQWFSASFIPVFEQADKECPDL